MTANNNECQVDMVRIQNFDENQTKTFDYNVIIKILFDKQRNLSYLRITAGQHTVYTKELQECKWVHESSGRGVVTISSSNSNVVIIYDGNDKSTREFFDNFQLLLEDESKSISSELDQEQVELIVNDLTESINTGCVDKAEEIAKFLSKSRVNIQFTLTNKVDNQEVTDDNRTKSENAVLRLKLVIECAIERKSIEQSIDIHFGTKLRSLKEQMEKETGIKSYDQYWFAFDRCPIPDEYIFGSSISIDSNQNRHQSSDRSIQSGDTLYLYIAQPYSLNLN